MMYISARNITWKEAFSVRPLRPARLLRRFKRFIETSDWDARIVRWEPLYNKFCVAAVILSGLVLSPILVAAFLQ